MIETHDLESRDVRTLLGMQSVGARVILALYVSAMAFVAVSSTAGTNRPWWPLILAIGVLGFAGISLIAVPGDPLPARWSAVIATCAPLTCAFSLIAAPAPFTVSTQGWAHEGTTIVLFFLCVRGRIRFAWMGFVGNAAVFATWFQINGLGPLNGLLELVVDLGTVAMGSVFALTIRPTARSVFDLRAIGARRAAELAARNAAAKERSRQLAELDRLARPMLTTIAGRAELTIDERVTCELLEAHLRDRLRAPGLVTPDIVDAVGAARARGVEVILIDDRTSDPLAPVARDRIHAQVVDIVERASSGDVRVRLLPPHRAAAASIYVRDTVRTCRREFDQVGVEVSTTSTPVEN